MRPVSTFGGGGGGGVPEKPEMTPKFVWWEELKSSSQQKIYPCMEGERLSFPGKKIL